MVGWPSGPRRQFQALVSSEAWVRIPLQSCICFFFFFSQQPDDSAAVQPEASTRRCTLRVGWPSGPRRQFKALVSSEAWVRIPLQSYIPVSLVGQDTRLSPARPGFKSRTGNFLPKRRKLGPNPGWVVGLSSGYVCLQSSVGRAGGC